MLGVNVRFGWGSFVGLLAAVLLPAVVAVGNLIESGVTDWRTLGAAGATAAGGVLFQWLRSWQANTVVKSQPKNV